MVIDANTARKKKTVLHVTEELVFRNAWIAHYNRQTSISLSDAC